MNLYHLRVFLTVAEHEHITRASEELILSQPAVTKIIQNLEHEVGLELIERHGRRIVLTHAGHLLHKYARRMFALEREMEEALAALRDIESGEITLAANTTTGVYLLPPIVSRFRARYPQVTLHINILNSHEIVEQILNWNLDFGLVESDPATLPPGLQVDVFAYDELVLVVAPGHRWSGLEALRPEVLRNGELVLREQGSGIREVIEHALLQRSEEHTSELQSPDHLVCRLLLVKKKPLIAGRFSQAHLCPAVPPAAARATPCGVRPAAAVRQHRARPRARLCRRVSGGSRPARPPGRAKARRGQYPPVRRTAPTPCAPAACPGHRFKLGAASPRPTEASRTGNAPGAVRNYVFFFKGPGAPRDLPFSPAGRSSD